MEQNTICFPTTRISQNKWLLGSEKPIGEESVSGEVFIACKEKNCRYALKIIRSPKYPSIIRKEVELQNVCSLLNLCKPVVDSWICKDRPGGVIITELLSETLGRFIKNVDDREKLRLVKKALEMLIHLHKGNIYHGDAHLNNFMLNNHKALFFIDMEKGGYLTPENATQKIKDDYGDIAASLERLSQDPKGQSIYDKISDIMIEDI